MQGASLGTNLAASEQMKENRRSSKRTRNMSRRNNKIKQSSKSKLTVSNNNRASSERYAKNNSILNYRTKNKEDRKSKAGRSPPPPQSQQSNIVKKNERGIKRNGDTRYIGVTKPASMFVTSSDINNSVTKSDTHITQKWNNNKQQSSVGSSSLGLSKSPQGKIPNLHAKKKVKLFLSNVN